jgi:co-chaperonin GroES (HSP10)
MKKHLLLYSLLLMAVTLAGQQLVTGSTDAMGLSGYPSEPQLLEADAQSLFWISGSSLGTAVNHPLLPDVFSDVNNIFFVKYDRDGNPHKSNYIRGASYANEAFSFEGGLTLMAKADYDVEASGQILLLGDDYHQEFIATYDNDCNLLKIIKIWDLTPVDYVYSEAVMDPQDGSIFVYGTASNTMELIGFGTVGKDLSPDYFYLIKFNRDLELEWVYNAGFDMNASGTSPYFGRIDVHPGNNGNVLVTGAYATESSPLIDGNSLPAYPVSYGMFSIMLNAAGSPQWIQDGPLNGLGHGTSIFEAYPMPDGDFVLAGVTNTGYFKLGQAEIVFPGGENYENQFVYRMSPNGDFAWGRALQNMRPNQDKKKKSAESDVFQAYVSYDAINWRNKILYTTGYFNTGTGFSIAGRTLDATYVEGVFVAAIDMDDGTELWGYGLTSDFLSIYGFDVDRSGNVSMMGSNSNSQDLEGITEQPVTATDYLFHVGIDYTGKALWYNNAHLATAPNYYRLNGVDLEVLPNGEVFSSMYMTESNNLVVGSDISPALVDTYSSWLLELKPDIELGGMVTDATGSPVYPGMVLAVKSAPWGSFPKVDTTLINDDGSYLFTDLYPGNYIVQAMTDPGDYPEGIPTYYGNSEGWSSALTIDVTTDIKTNILNIELSEVPKLTSMDGSGELSGTLSTEEGTFLKGTMAQPTKKTGVILLGKAKKSTMAGEVVAYVETDDQGRYVFDYVPDGDYILAVDVAGLEMMETHEVTIAGNQIVSGLNYTVSNEGIYAGWPTKVSFQENKTLNIWPNPGEGRIMMDLPAAGDYSVKIYTADGRLIRNEEFRSSGGVSNIDITDEYKGMYILKIEGPDTNTTRKYIKK